MSPVYRDDEEGRQERLDILLEQAGEQVHTARQVSERAREVAGPRRRHVTATANHLERRKERTMPSEVRRRPEATAVEDQPIRPSEDTIRDRAYRKFDERGREPGHDLDDWLQAERELQEPQRSQR